MEQKKKMLAIKIGKEKIGKWERGRKRWPMGPEEANTDQRDGRRKLWPMGMGEGNSLKWNKRRKCWPMEWIMKWDGGR